MRLHDFEVIATVRVCVIAEDRKAARELFYSRLTEEFFSEDIEAVIDLGPVDMEEPLP